MARRDENERASFSQRYDKPNQIFFRQSFSATDRSRSADQTSDLLESVKDYSESIYYRGNIFNKTRDDAGSQHQPAEI